MNNYKSLDCVMFNRVLLVGEATRRVAWGFCAVARGGGGGLKEDFSYILIKY